MVPLRRPPLGRIRDAVLTRLEYARRAGRRSPKKRVVVVVGMHRSGTSALAGTLQEAGLYLGDVSRSNTFNPKGTREHVEIVKLHDAILAHSGGSWRTPPQEIDWTDEHRARRDRIIHSFSRAELWGFKDPRAVFLLDFWREALGEILTLVGVFREPSQVVASLLQRDGGSAQEWLSLWTRYNSELVRESRANPFPLVEFVPDAELFRRRLVPVLDGLGLRKRRRLRHFVPGLVSSDDNEQAGPGSGPAVELYEELRATAKTSWSPGSR